MQKARRLACSTASMSSPSNTSLTLRGRSRTSSAGGDYVETSKSNIPTDPLESKLKLPKRTNKSRLPLKAGKKGKKTAKASKSARPTFGSLQNTIVLAPFHTLKKCFQTKLVDLYLNEKNKKNNHRTKMAEKPNMLFEYDVMELKPSEEKNEKKEKKGSRAKKGRVRFSDKEPKSNRNRSKNEKAQSYCQCEKPNPNKSKEHKTNRAKDSSSRNQSRKPEKRGFQTSLASIDYQREFSGIEESKRRRLDGLRITNLSAGPEYKIIMADLLQLNSTSCSELRPETNLSYSNVSSHSKIDSWETISDSPSYKVFEGSLAISTTSFDSCLEQSQRDSRNYSEPSGIANKGSGSNSRYNTRLKALKEKSGHGNRGGDFEVNLVDDESGQNIMTDKVSKSDGQLIDFMDREPQSQVVASGEISQHLQQLRRKSKTRTTKSSSRENDSINAYFLRSQSRSKEPVKIAEGEERSFLGEFRNGDDLERSGRLDTVSGVQQEEGNVEREENNVAPVQVPCVDNLTLQNLLTEDKTSSQSQADLSQPLTKLPSSNIDDSTNCVEESETADEVKRCSAQKETNTNLNLSDEPPCEIFHERKTNTTTDEQNDSNRKKSPEIENTDFKSEGRTEEGPRLLEDFVDQSFVDHLPAPETTNQFQESSDVDRQVAPQPQDKEPSFIFGPRTMTDRLGESCEFSFGLNWVLSDDDNSEHGDHFL